MHQPPQDAQPSINHPRISFTQTFASSLDEKPQRYGLDRSLARGIMQNNSSLIVQQQQQIQLNDIVQFNKEQQMSKVIIQYQNRYNQVKSASAETQNRIKRYRDDLQRLTQQNKKLTLHKIDSQMSLSKCNSDYDALCYQLESLMLRLASYANIEERIKQDITYYKKLLFDANLNFMKKKSEAKRFDNSSQRQRKISLRCKTLLHSIDTSLVQNRSNRDFGISRMERVLTQKQQFVLKQKQRQFKIQQSIIEGQSTKMLEEKAFRKVLFANKLLKVLLFYKMKNLMAKYKQVYDCFNIIKQNTNITTGEQLVQRYLKRDQTYGILLSTLSTLQPRIQELKSQRQQLLESSDRIMSEKVEIEEEYYKLRKEAQDMGYKQLQRINKKLQMINVYRHDWSNWALSTQSIFKGIPKRQISNSYQSTTTLIKDTLTTILQYLQKDEDTDKHNSKSMIEEAFEKQLKTAKLTAEEMLDRNVRIRRWGSEIRQQQEEDAQYDLVSEKDYMQMARKAVKKQFIMKRKNRYFKS